jgi:membrane protease YdiL (CAAX protease family)
MPWDFWLIFLVLGVLVPWRGRARLKRLLSQPPGGTKEKLTLYGATVAFQWAITVVVAWRAFARGLTSAEMGLARGLSADLFVASVVGAALLCTFQWFNLRRVGRASGPVIDLMRQLAEHLLPLKSVEFAPYCALAVTAGVCEEFLYRGFAMAALSRAGLATWMVVVLTSILFGFAHAYQGRGGMIGTGLLGLIFAVSRRFFSSLVPVMVWHAAVDVIAGVAGPRFLLGQRPAEEAGSTVTNGESNR